MKTDADWLSKTELDLQAEFSRLCRERWEKGAESYGQFGYLEPGVSLANMMAEELADLANYARALFVKVRLIEMSLQNGGFIPRK